MEMTVFRKEEPVKTSEVLQVFKQSLEERHAVPKSEIEELCDIVSKNPTDKFIISEKPDAVVMQGDILIWSDICDEFKESFSRIQQGDISSTLVLQKTDSLTGDHRLIPVPSAHYTLKDGKFIPSFIISFFCI